MFITILIQAMIILLIIAYASIYLINIRNKTIQPILATWIFLSLATIMSFWTNFYDSGYSGLLTNSYNIIDTLATLLILYFLLKQKNIRRTFTLFEKNCVGLILIISIFWLITSNHIATHLLLQLILIIAYLPTLVQLWNASKNSESIKMWSLNGLAATFGSIEPIQVGAILPMVYAVIKPILTFSFT